MSNAQKIAELIRPPLLATEPGGPQELIAYDRAVGCFASAPHRFAPHVALAAQPNTARSPQDIVAELCEAATPRIDLTPKEVDHIAGRLRLLFWPPKEPTLRCVAQAGHNKLMHDEGSSLVPPIILLAAHWLTAQTETETVLPASVTKYWLHGQRLAILEHCLTEPRTAQQTGTALGIYGAGPLFGSLTRQGLLARRGIQSRSQYTVASHKPTIISLVTGLHALQDVEYAERLRHTVATEIVRSPELYGHLAHSALAQLVIVGKIGSPARAASARR